MDLDQFSNKSRKSGIIIQVLARGLGQNLKQFFLEYVHNGIDKKDLYLGKSLLKRNVKRTRRWSLLSYLDGALSVWFVSGTIYQEVMSYNNLSEISSPVEGNGEINQSSSSSSTSSGWLYFVLYFCFKLFCKNLFKTLHTSAISESLNWFVTVNLWVIVRIKKLGCQGTLF